jgi:hypothetical protein
LGLANVRAMFADHETHHPGKIQASALSY